MKIKNISTSIALIPEIKDSEGAGLIVQPNQEVIIYDEDAEKSPTLQGYITDHIIEVTGPDEPIESLETELLKTGGTMTGTLILYKDNSASLRLSGKDFAGVTRQSYAGVYYSDQYNSPGLGVMKTRVIQGGNEYMDYEIQSSHSILISAQDINFHDGFVKIGANKYIDFHAQADGDTVAVQQLRVTRKDETTFGDANVSAVELQSIAAPGASALPLEINTTTLAGLNVGGPLGFVGGTTITVTGSVIVFQNGVKTATMDLVAGTLVFA